MIKRQLLLLLRLILFSGICSGENSPTPHES